MTELLVFQIMTDEGNIILHKPTCYNCGNPIQIEEGFMMDYEPYQSLYPREPDIPEKFFLICGECVPGWNQLKVKQ